MKSLSEHIFEKLILNKNIKGNDESEFYRLVDETIKEHLEYSLDINKHPTISKSTLSIIKKIVDKDYNIGIIDMIYHLDEVFCNGKYKDIPRIKEWKKIDHEDKFQYDYVTNKMGEYAKELLKTAYI